MIAAWDSESIVIDQQRRRESYDSEFNAMMAGHPPRMLLSCTKGIYKVLLTTIVYRALATKQP